MTFIQLAYREGLNFEYMMRIAEGIGIKGHTVEEGQEKKILEAVAADKAREAELERRRQHIRDYEAKEKKKKRDRIDRNSVVYFVLSKSTNRMKIGHSADLRKRFMSIQTGSGLDLELMYTTRGGYRHEQDFHEKFQEYRVRGEWFRYEGKLRAFVENRLETAEARMVLERARFARKANWKKEAREEELKEIRKILGDGDDKAVME